MAPHPGQTKSDSAILPNQKVLKYHAPPSIPDDDERWAWGSIASSRPTTASSVRSFYISRESVVTKEILQIIPLEKDETFEKEMQAFGISDEAMIESDDDSTSTTTEQNTGQLAMKDLRKAIYIV